MFKGPIVNKIGGNLGGREKNTDKTYGLICGGVAVANKIAIGQIVELLQADDAKNYGIDAAYDANHKVLVRYHIDEFFQYCPDGILFLMLVPVGTSQSDIWDPDAEFTPINITEVRASSQLEVVSKGATGDTISVKATKDETDTVLAEYTVLADDTPALITSGILASLVAKKAAHLHAFDGSIDTNTKVVIQAPAGSGVGGNDYVLGYTKTGTSVYHLGTGLTEDGQFSQGITAATAGPGAAYALMANEDTRREIKKLGSVLNPGADYEPTLTDGLDEDVILAIPKAQAVVDKLLTQFIYLDAAILEGRQANGTISGLKDLRLLSGRNVSVCIAQDPHVAALDALYAKYAAVGTVLGNLAIRKVSENLGSVDVINKPNAKKADENYSLTNAAKLRWLTAALSSGRLFSTLTVNDQKSLTDKGYIYAGNYSGYPGIYFNDSPTCIDAADDYSYIERNSPWNKAARYLREALIPKMKSKFKKDATTGYPTPSTIANWEQVAKKKLELMVTDDEVSAIGVYIDPAQAPSQDSPLKIKVALVIDGILREIDIDLSLANSL